MMEAASTSETSVNFYQTTWRNNSEDSHLHTRHCENLKSHYYNLIRYLTYYRSMLLFWGVTLHELASAPVMKMETVCFSQNVGIYLQVHMSSQPRTTTSTKASGSSSLRYWDSVFEQQLSALAVNVLISEGNIYFDNESQLALNHYV
jgi:hypothetical protein